MDTIKTPTKQEMFPWLTEEQIQKIEDYTSNLSWVGKQQKQQALYNAYIDKQKSSNISNSRVMTENELYSKSLQEKDSKQKNYLQSNVRQEQLADIVKEKYNLRADASTQEVINWVMQQANDMWVSIDSLNKYLAWESDDFLYEMWFKEKWFWEEVWEVWKNVWAWLLDSALSIPRMVAGAWHFTWRRLASKVKWVDMDELPENAYTTAMSNFIDDDSRMANVFWADKESTSYQVWKIWWDIAQTAIWGWLAKWAIKNAPWIIWKAWNLLNGAKWTLGKMLAWWIEGAWDMTLYSIIADNKLPSREETGIGWAIGAAIPWLWAARKAGKKGLEKVAAKLELSWMLNPAKLNTIKNQLITEGVDLASAGMKKGGTAEDVWKWMIERDMQWSKEQIIQKLWEHAKKSHALKKEVLKQSETLHNVDSAKKSLEAMYEQVAWKPWLEAKTQRISELYNKDWLTLSELDEVKSLLDDTVNIYTNAWDVGASTLKEWLNNVRKDLRKYIETEADKEGLWNIKLLNNETQVSKSLQDAISRKDSADAAREMLSILSKGTIWWALGGTALWPFDWNTFTWKLWNFLVWALAWQFLFSTQAKTKLASLLNKMTWGTKKELERLVNWEVQTVSKWTEKELQKIVEDLNLKEVNPQEFTKEEANRLLGNTDDIVNKTDDIVRQEENVAEQVENAVNKTEDVVQKVDQTVQKEWTPKDFARKPTDTQSVDDIIWEFGKEVQKYKEKWEKFTLNNLVNNTQKYKDAKIEYDNFLNNMAKDIDGKALTPSLKILKSDWSFNWNWIRRTLQKAYNKENGIDGVTDIVRGTTAVKDKESMNKALEWIKKNWIDTDSKYKFDDKFSNPTNLWYKDLSFLYPTKNWVLAEVQINTPNMLVAKEWKGAIEMWIISEADYNKLIEKVWVEGGKWHKYYEEWRELNDAVTKGKITGKEKEKALKRMSEIEKESQAYYAKFEE